MPEATKDTKHKSLTKTLIDNLKPADTRYAVADTKVSGLQVRVTPNGVKTFSVRCRMPDGRRVGVTLGDASGMTVETARQLAIEKIAELRKGVNPNEQKRNQKAAEEAQKKREAEAENPMTLRRFIEEHYAPFVRGELNKQTALRAAENTIARLIAAFDEMLDNPLEAITTERVDQWRAKQVDRAIARRKKAREKDEQAHPDRPKADPKSVAREDRESCRTAGDRHVACLRSALTHAVKVNLLPVNPLKGDNGVKLQKADLRKHIRPFTAEEQKRLFAQIDAREARMRSDLEGWNRKRREAGAPELPPFGPIVDYVRPLIALLFATGMRRGEALKLQWRDVDLVQGRVTIRAEVAKSGKQRIIPLTRSALDLLTAWKAQAASPFPEQPVFTSSRHGGALGDIKKVWRNLLKDAKLPRLRLHDIRHTTATEALKRSDVAVVQKILGHAQITTTARYLHPDEEQMRSALEGLDNRESNITPFPKVQGEAE